MQLFCAFSIIWYSVFWYIPTIMHVWGHMKADFALQCRVVRFIAGTVYREDVR